MVPAAVVSELRRSLLAAESAVASHYGRVEVAVEIGSGRPLLVGSDPGAPLRLWSLSKPVTAVTMLAHTRNQSVASEAHQMALYLSRALRMSDNCAQRALMLKVQAEVGGIRAARLALAHTISLAGGSVNTDVMQADDLGFQCITSTYTGIPRSEVSEPALLAGTGTWTIADALKLAAGLRTGIFGSPGRVVSKYMAEPKLYGVEPGADVTTNPNWGAGAAFPQACWQLAYKAGWGGAASHIQWLATQIGSFSLRDFGFAAFAVAYQPYSQPANDDPRNANAPEAFADVFSALRSALSEAHLSPCS